MGSSCIDAGSQHSANTRPFSINFTTTSGFGCGVADFGLIGVDEYGSSMCACACECLRGVDAVEGVGADAVVVNMVAVVAEEVVVLRLRASHTCPNDPFPI